MRAGARVALGVGAGYLLGRTRKMRLAFMVAAAGATGRFGVAPTELLVRGVRKVLDTPEMNEVTELVRGELADAARSAAIAATSGRVEALNERLRPGLASGAGEKSPAEDVADEREPEEAEREADSDEAEEPVPADDSAGRRLHPACSQHVGQRRHEGQRTGAPRAEVSLKWRDRLERTPAGPQNAESVDDLKAAMGELLHTVARRTTSSVTGRLNATTETPTDFAQQGGRVKSLTSRQKSRKERAGASGATEKLKHTLSSDSEGADERDKQGKEKVTDVVEAIDVGVPSRWHTTTGPSSPTAKSSTRPRTSASAGARKTANVRSKAL